MAQAPVKKRAFEDLDLLHAVASFKDKFYYRAWARYDLATPGTMRLVPPEKVLQKVKLDYDEMQFMIFGERPEFDAMMAGLRDLEVEINAL